MDKKSVMGNSYIAGRNSRGKCFSKHRDAVMGRLPNESLSASYTPVKDRVHFYLLKRKSDNPFEKSRTFSFNTVYYSGLPIVPESLY